MVSALQFNHENFRTFRIFFNGYLPKELKSGKEKSLERIETTARTPLAPIRNRNVLRAP